MKTCKQCGLNSANTDTKMLRYWITRSTGSVGEHWEPRLRQITTPVCPKCDSYALGGEHWTSMALYSPVIGAFLTLHDWDWWSCDPSECDIRQWSDFGCLTFTEAALRSTVEYLRESQPDALIAKRILMFETPLKDLVGIPDGEDYAGREWAKLLHGLRVRLNNEYTLPELNAAIRLLASTLVNFTPSATQSMTTFEAN